jgi:zinc protease
MPAALKRLYDRTYAPYRATFVLVGDFDPAVAEGEVGSFFSTWKAAAQALKAGAEALPASSTGNRGVEAFLFADRSAPTSVSIASFAEPSQDRASARDAQFLEQLATDMLSRRLALRASPAVARASAAIYTHFSMARLATLDVEAKDRDWRGALTFGGAQLHGALAHGFEQAELEAQLDVMREALRRAAAPRTSGALADAIVDAVGRKLVFTEAADPAASAAYLGKVRLDDVNAAFRQAWSNPARLIFVTHNRRVAGAEAAIIAAWSDSAAAVAGK